MNPTLLVLVLAAQQGYWLGGREYEVTLAWNLEGRPDGFRPPAGAVLSAELSLGALTLSTTRVELDPDAPVAVKLAVPRVRVRTPMRWRYRVTHGQPAQELARGTLELQVFPDDVLADLAQGLRRQRVLVWDDAEALPALLARAEVPHERIADASGLTFSRPDTVLIGHDRLVGVPLEQSRLLAQAQRGATVVIFRQTRVARVAGHPVMERLSPAGLVWREDHPLLAELRPADLESTVAVAPRDGFGVRPLRLPPDEPALELAYYSDDLAGLPPGDRDALLLVEAVGSGRLVLCQLPLGDWAQDPRSQLLLRNVLAYAASRPEPTPAPPHRPAVPLPPRVPPQRTIAVPSGATP